MQPIHDPATTTTLALDTVLSRIAHHELVAGILLLGSTGTAAFTPASDYDMLVVFSALPAPLLAARQGQRGWPRRQEGPPGG